MELTCKQSLYFNRQLKKNLSEAPDTDLSEMRVAKAASLALMLQDRAEPSLLFLRVLMAMILQILRTEERQTREGQRSPITVNQKAFFDFSVWMQTEEASVPCSDICLCSQILSTFRAFLSVSKGTRSMSSSR